MVQAADPGNLMPESEVPLGNKGKAVETPGLAVKMEVEDSLEEEHGPDNKRFKYSLPLQQWNMDGNASSCEQPQYDVLNDLSPLGLRLRKSPSLLDLIQMRLSQGNPSKACVGNDDSTEGGKKNTKPTSGVPDKLKASNFPATLLKIGTWECVSRYEGDLVAKCYFAKRKLVWEVLNGGLKSKIEIQWSDITAIKAACPDNGPGSLDLVVSRPPLFFRETNPQPRKHTLWQATSDFTGGQASRHRRHFLQVPQGLLSKHFDKLINCDPRLSELSRQPDAVLSSPFFEPRCPLFEDQGDRSPNFDHIKGEYGSPFSGHQDAASPSAGLSSMSDTRDLVRTPVLLSQDNPSTSSEIESRVIEENTSCDTGENEERNPLDQFKVPGIRPSMSVSDFVNHIGHCISEKMTSDNPFLEANRDALEEITQCLLSDSQGLPASDEKSLMSRVNSLYCLLQKDPASAQNLLINRDPSGGYGEEYELDSAPEKKTPPDSAGGKQPPPISRKESAGDLLLYLPRIASLPQFLFNIAEDAENEAAR
ncbi:unnamed protein product [Spirodela intermedia]|uniref:TRF2/HOY1 PH-like domain-containing protein n=1 Tax=Spirodela intermedia TaxID=51605 RepID=A0A7I8JLQ0_SPIIN|nr:unnamed protein product [Spirodela intermedia]CAA6671010.1 unnamed protein product [Spirodela intermedia]